MPEKRLEVAELCREHGVAPELLADGDGLEQLLDRGLQECEDQIAANGTPSREGLVQLRGLIRLAQHARRSGDNLVEANLARVDEELRYAESQTLGLQQQLGEPSPVSTRWPRPTTEPRNWES